MCSGVRTLVDALSGGEESMSASGGGYIDGGREDGEGQSKGNRMAIRRRRRCAPTKPDIATAVGATLASPSQHPQARTNTVNTCHSRQLPHLPSRALSACSPCSRLSNLPQCICSSGPHVRSVGVFRWPLHQAVLCMCDTSISPALPTLPGRPENAILAGKSCTGNDVEFSSRRDAADDRSTKC